MSHIQKIRVYTLTKMQDIEFIFLKKKGRASKEFFDLVVRIQEDRSLRDSIKVESFKYQYLDNKNIGSSHELILLNFTIFVKKFMFTITFNHRCFRGIALKNSYSFKRGF